MGWELLVPKHDKHGNGVIIPDKSFDSREAVEIYCDMIGAKLVSLRKFNELNGLNLMGDEC